MIIDTDIGDDLDDAFALALALTDPGINLVGVTTAWGDTRLRVLLVRRLLQAAGRPDVIVAQGSATADPTPFTQAQWAKAAGDASAAPDAVEFIADQVRQHPHDITLVELAPMSNLQTLMRRHPGALAGLKRVVFMGGSIKVGYPSGGAVPVSQPSAEYNVASRPDAVADLIRSGVEVVMFPLDSTQLKFDEVRRDRLFAYGAPLSDALTLLYHQWRLWNAWGQITPTLFDAIPVAWLIDPSLCPTVPMRITVDAQGFTRPVDGDANVAVCLKLHEDATQQLIMQRLAPTFGRTSPQEGIH